LADRLRGEGEPSDGVEEGMILEKCQIKAKISWKSVKKLNFLFAVIKKCVILLSVKSRNK
jgi:hypothetical protein